jgi:UDP-glucose 4-epimerase
MSFFANKTVAVTGGCGFIGSHLVRKLQSLGASVIVIDSLEYGRLESLPLVGNIRFHQHKLGTDNPPNLVGMLKGTDYVFHLAAEKHRPGKDPETILRTNVRGTAELIKAVERVGVKKLVFTSSLYAYGRMTAPVMAETEWPRPATTYGDSKLIAEHLLHRASVLTRIPMICMRLFFTYGPGQYNGTGYKSVIVKNFERIVEGQHPIIYGDGQQVLDYIYVDDVMSALLQAAVTQDQFGVFNVGSGEPITVNHLVRTMLVAAGVVTLVEPISAPSDWTVGSYRVADTTKFDQAFGIQLRVNLLEGLQRTWGWIINGR